MNQSFRYDAERKWVNEYIENQRQAYSILRNSGLISEENIIWQILQVHFDTGIYYSKIYFKNLSAQEIINIVSDYIKHNGLIYDQAVFKNFRFDIKKGRVAYNMANTNNDAYGNRI